MAAHRLFHGRVGHGYRQSRRRPDSAAMMVRGRKNAGSLRPPPPLATPLPIARPPPPGPSRPDRPRPRRPLQPRPGRPAGHPAARRGHARLLAGAHPHVPGVVAVRGSALPGRSPARRSGSTDVPCGVLLAGGRRRMRGAVRGGGVGTVRFGSRGEPWSHRRGKQRGRSRPPFHDH